MKLDKNIMYIIDELTEQQLNVTVSSLKNKTDNFKQLFFINFPINRKHYKGLLIFYKKDIKMWDIGFHTSINAKDLF